MNSIKEYAYSIAKRYSIICAIIGVVGIAIIMLLMFYANSSSLNEDGSYNMIFTFLIIAYLVILCVFPLNFLISTKKGLEKLTINDEAYKKGIEYNGMKNFVLCEEGLLGFVLSKPLYIKYIDMQRVYLYKFTQKVFFIPVTSTYAINIETLEKNILYLLKRK